MKIASHQLDAFFHTAKLRSFSKAADQLAVTQSALSQRISNLEMELETTLFVRDPSGPILTTAGEVLLRYCQATNAMEQDVLQQLQTTSEELGGTVRIATFSSVLRSVVVPSLAGFLRKHPKVHCEFRSFEVAELPLVLRRAEADFVILDYRLQKNGVIEEILGEEDYVVVESSKFETPKDVYLDHNPEDTTTEFFFQSQSSKPKKWRRSFMGDIYGVMGGAALGLGRAVVSKHLMSAQPGLSIVKGYSAVSRTVTLNYIEQPFYSRLHKAVVEELKQNTKKFF